jgi:peptide/nickel transport system substrate-binding protein
MLWEIFAPSSQTEEAMQDYWSRFLTQRVSRRRAIATSGAAGLGAALLAACGSNKSGGSKNTAGGSGTTNTAGASSGGTSGSSTGSTAGGSGGKAASLITQPTDTTSVAKKGGVVKYHHYTDISSFEPGLANAPNEYVKELTNAWLLSQKAGHLQPGTNEIGPDMAESWEVSPDKLTLTFKMRQGVTWHNKPPVNGRPFTTDDVLFSWERLKAVNSNRGVIANSVNPSAPIIDVTSPDSKTIVMKLTQPLSYILEIIAYIVGGSFALLPKEADSGYDPRHDIIGLGPYYLADYKPSASFTLKRNDNWWDKPFPLPDQIDMPIITEYSARLAQLQTGNLYTQYDLRGLDVLPLKSQRPEMLLYKGPMTPSQGHTAFGWKQDAWNDIRMRQALSHAWDRDGHIEAVYSASKFEAAGIPVETRWNTEIYANFEGDWLDPKSKDFGPNASYFNYDKAEAKKLMEAAGYANGLDVVSTTPAQNAYGPDYNTQLEILENFGRDVGMKVTRNEIDYTSNFIPNFRNAKGQHEGWAQKIGPGFADSALGRLAYEVWSKGGDNFYGFSASGRNDKAGDPEVDRMIEAGQAEFDNDKRRKIVQDLQRYLAQKVYLLTWPGAASGWVMAWPCLNNVRTFQDFRGVGNDATLTPIFWWLDPTKKPMA